MTPRGARVWLLLALRLSCALDALDALAVPQRRDGEWIPHRLSTTTTTTTTTTMMMSAKDKLDGFFHLKESATQKPVAPAPPRKKAPQFMVDLFNAVSKTATASRTTGTPRSQKDILQGNIVRSFEDKGHTGERFHFFNISSLSRGERMIKAELRWFRQRQRRDRRDGPHVYRVDVYEVLESRVKPWRGNLITSRLVPLYTQGWEVFNVTQTVSKWVGASQENNGLLVVVTTLPSGVWLDSAPERPGKPSDRNAYLVVFSDDARTEITGNQSTHHEHWKATTAADAPTDDRRDRRRRAIPDFLRGRPQPCQRVPLFVDFEEIGWAGWIISPRGYNAYHCKGSCPFPLGESLRATNHATVQSIMHALKLSDDVGSPCCVPDKLQSISLLYFDDEENVVLKQYDDMVAVSCGCH